MFIESVKNNGTIYLRLVNSVYTKDAKGSPTCRKKIIQSIGPLTKYDDGKPDYVKRLKESFKNGNPLIPELKQYCDKTAPLEKYKFEFQEGDPDCIGHPKLYSQVLIERILEELGLISLIAKQKQLTNIEFDLVGFFRLLIYGRLLSPASKISSIAQNKNYYNQILDDDYYKYNVYDTLAFINKNSNQIFKRMNNRLIQSFGRTTNTLYYDVTNFYFETEYNDEDTDEETGLRKRGVSKEERSLPIVQMGLFMDEQGLPLTIKTFPGNTLDHQTMINSLNDTVDGLNLERFIFVGDRGMYRGNNTYHLVNSNNGYIISKSIEKTNQLEKNWIFDNKDYTIESSSFKYKSRIIKRSVNINSTEKKDITEKVVVYWSEKFYKKQLAENKSFLDFIEKLKSNPSSFRISSLQTKGLRKFIKKEFINKETGELIDSCNLESIIDMDKINKFKQSFGYYQIVTSEINMPDKEIMEKYHGLSRIEDQFKTMKGTLDTRPIFVRTKENINAHLMICMISLTVLRIIQNKIVDYNKKIGKTNESYWSMGLTGNRIQTALNKWTVETITERFYRFNNLDDNDLKLILNAFSINIPTKLYGKMELKNIKTGIKII